MDVSRRSLFRTTTALGAGVVLTPLLDPLATAPAAAAPGGFPDYRFLKVALDKSTLRYNPTGELIFPCVRGVYDKLANPLGRYYLYYGPHDAPGGICLAYADSLEGPWREHPANPIVGRSWAPHYDVSHVASPHVVWRSDLGEMWLYFHGENTTTRLARSTDGVRFTYDRVVLSTSMLAAGTTETSYARVFAHALPHLGAQWVMLFMINDASNRRSIGWGWSADGRRWTFAQQPLIRPADVGSRDIGAPTLLERNGSTYVVYHQNVEAGGRMLITEVGNRFDRRNHLGTFHTPSAGFPDNDRCAAPSFGTMNGVSYMIYEAGARLEGNIAIARAI